MKRIYYLLYIVLMSILSVSCSEIDNYDGPSETLTGCVIDEVTNKPIITEQPNGFRIKMEEVSWSDNPQPEYFWGKADGTFNNTKIFPATYEISPVEGAFFPVEPVKAEVKGTTKIEFKVMPYLTVLISDILYEGDRLNVTYTISRAKTGDKIIDSRVFVSTNPNVGSNILENELSPMKDLSGISDEEILKTTFKESISELEKGKIYYVKVGARTDNPSKRYNFTETVVVKP